MIPAELAVLDQWVTWRREVRSSGATKVPLVAMTARRADSTDPATWSPLERARRAALIQRGGACGIGFVFSADGPYCGIDLDKCRDPDTGAIAPWAAAIVERLASYTEVSPSGTGLHVIVRAALPEGRGRKRAMPDGAIEIYDRARFFCMTARELAGARREVAERQAVVDELLAELFPSNRKPGWDGRAAPTPLREEDAVVLERLERLSRTWREASAGARPANSETDWAIAHAAIWAARGDLDQVERLVRSLSSLSRKKWDEPRPLPGGGRGTYLRYTLERAGADHEGYYDPERPNATPPPPPRRVARAVLGIAAPQEVDRGPGSLEVATWINDHDCRGGILDCKLCQRVARLVQCNRAELWSQAIHSDDPTEPTQHLPTTCQLGRLCRNCARHDAQAIARHARVALAELRVGRVLEVRVRVRADSPADARQRFRELQRRLGDSVRKLEHRPERWLTDGLTASADGCELVATLLLAPCRGNQDGRGLRKWRKKHLPNALVHVAGARLDGRPRWRPVEHAVELVQRLLGRVGAWAASSAAHAVEALWHGVPRHRSSKGLAAAIRHAGDAEAEARAKENPSRRWAGSYSLHLARARDRAELDPLRVATAAGLALLAEDKRVRSTGGGYSQDVTDEHGRSIRNWWEVRAWHDVGRATARDDLRERVAAAELERARARGAG